MVSGGMVWWKDFICLACYNMIGQRDEVTNFIYKSSFYFMKKNVSNCLIALANAGENTLLFD